ncbi:MAG: patatin-like phospholipase family protein, partial [Conexibacter sp.]|nr:patatin-like phospholipase family protein [Conexibacter sp.]
MVSLRRMDASPFLRPDVLVLAGGGIVGEAWMNGLLAGIEDGANVDLRTVEAFVGTSAGSIVAARLVAGRRLPRPGGGHDSGAAFAEAAEADADAEVEPEEARDRDRGASGLQGVLRDAARVGWAASAPVAGAALAL